MINDFNYVVLSIIFCDFTICTEELKAYLNNQEVKYEISEDNRDLKTIYFPSPPKGGSHLTKILLWEPEIIKGVSCFFTNYEDGRYTLVLNYCKDFKHRAIRVAFSNNQDSNPSFMFNYIDFSNNNESERIIYLIKDDKKWEFFTKGEPLFFENIDNYTKKRKAERFNKTIILEYLGKVGIDMNSKKFWEHHKSTFFQQIKW
jgi:hypothetical protein